MAFERADIAADLFVGAAGKKINRAFEAADSTLGGAGRFALLVCTVHAAANGEADTAGAEETALLGFAVVGFFARLGCGGDAEVTPGGKVNLLATEGTGQGGGALYDIAPLFAAGTEQAA